MTELRLFGALQLRDNSLGQGFAQLDTPLVKRINVPDSALREDGMLVKGDEFPQCFGRQPVDKDRVGWTVALEDPVGDEPIRRALGFYFLMGFAEGQRLGLGEDVRQKHIVVPPQGVERLSKGDEVTGNEPGSLMD